MLETVNYHNFNKSNVFVLILDASKAFDRVNYCKLFGELLKRDISPFVLRLLLYMYTSQDVESKMGTYCIKLFYCEKRSKTGRRIIPFTICYIRACLIVFPDARDNHVEVPGYRHLSRCN